MATDRESTIRRAEKLLKQGRLEAAIAEYVQAVEEQPRDWNTVNILGDLYAKAGQIESAVHQYTRVAEHFAREGFFQKAAALYKKIVKIKPHDERVLLQLVDLSEQQGLLAEAKSCLSTIAECRRRRGDRRGSAEVILRLAKLDPTDFGALLLAARAAGELGDTAGAAERFKTVGVEFLRRDRTDEGLKALSDAAALDPGNDALRLTLMRASLQAGQVDLARRYVTTPDEEAEVAAVTDALDANRDAAESRSAGGSARVSDPERQGGRAPSDRAGDASRRGRALRHAKPEVRAEGDEPLVRAERELRAGRLETGHRILSDLLAADAASREAVLALGRQLIEVDVDAAFLCLDVASDAAVAENDFKAATSALRAFIGQVPAHVPALMKLIEISVDGGLEAIMYAAQAQLADAYLASGRAAEARLIAEDLVAREPWQRLNIDRLRRALVALGEADPDRIIADHLSGESPFALTELWEQPGVESASGQQPSPRRESAGAPQDERGKDVEFEEDVEIELAFRAEAEPELAVLADGDVERVFDEWLNHQPAAEAPAEAAGEAVPPLAPVIASGGREADEPAGSVADEAVDEGVELAAVVVESRETAFESPVAARDEFPEAAGELAPALDVPAEPAPEPPQAFEPVPAGDEAGAPMSGIYLTMDGPPAELAADVLSPLTSIIFTGDDEAIEPHDEGSGPAPSVETSAELAPELFPPFELAPPVDEANVPVPGIDLMMDESPGKGQPTLELDQPVWGSVVPETVVDASVESEIAPLPHPVLAESLEALADLVPCAEASTEAAGDHTPLPLNLATEPVSALGVPVEAVVEPSMELEPAMREVQAELSPAAEGPVELLAEIAAEFAVEPPHGQVAEPTPGADEPEAARDVSDIPLEAFPDLVLEIEAVGGILDGVPAEERLELAEADPVPVTEGVVVDLSVAIGELRAGVQPAMIDESGAVSEPVASEADDLDRVFEMFRDEAVLRGLTDTGAQQLKLAAAYREIGMIDECLGALEVAARSPRHRFEAASQLAEMLRGQGRTREAVEWFERAAEAPAPNADASRSLLYDLGKTLSDVGESERALAVFLELEADAPAFRDVAVCVRRLTTAT